MKRNQQTIVVTVVVEGTDGQKSTDNYGQMRISPTVSAEQIASGVRQQILSTLSNINGIVSVTMK